MQPATGFRRMPLRPDQMTARVTDTRDLFVLAHLGIPRIEPANWSLTMDGNRDTPPRRAEGASQADCRGRASMRRQSARARHADATCCECTLGRRRSRDSARRAWHRSARAISLVLRTGRRQFRDYPQRLVRDEVSVDGGVSYMRAALEPRRGWAWDGFSLFWIPDERGEVTPCRAGVRKWRRRPADRGRPQRHLRVALTSGVSRATHAELSRQAQRAFRYCHRRHPGHRCARARAR
jgi:hypothetical protein